MNLARIEPLGCSDTLRPFAVYFPFACVIASAIVPACRSTCLTFRTGDPILTIEARMVHSALRALTWPHNCAGERPCRDWRGGAWRAMCSVVSGKFLARPRVAALVPAAGWMSGQCHLTGDRLLNPLGLGLDPSLQDRADREQGDDGDHLAAEDDPG